MSRVIMIGIDGSANSITALRWAVDYAAVRHAVVRAVHVSTPSRRGLLRRRHRIPETEQVHDAANVETVLSEAPRGVDGKSVLVEHRVVVGTPGAALVDLSHDADLLVVGATGREWDTRVPVLPLGPTARYVMRHAACPVTVVRHSHVRSEPHRSKPDPAGAAPAPNTGRRCPDTHAERKRAPL